MEIINFPHPTLRHRSTPITKVDDELKQIKWRDLPIKEETVPKVIGMTLRDAISLLENLGLKVEIQGRGRVSSQSQDPNSKLIFGSVIKLKLK